jgi:serine protease Do/serine protease DegQ
MTRLFAAAAAVAVFAVAAPTFAQEAPAHPSFAPVIKRVSPAVVNIGVRGTVAAPRNPFFDDPGFRRFFGLPPDAAPREREFRSAGSGVIVDAERGFIVTNAHVIKNASEITITLVDDLELKAEVVGTDDRSDVAVLKVVEGKLPAEIALADSAQLQVGDFVIAIGNPFGLQHTVTSGIVSALGRSGINRDNLEDFIQTDAAINPGNSGGALVSLDGELVGINSVILSSQGGGNIGIGFAIPSNMVRSIMEQLIEHGEVSRGQLGVSTISLSPEFRKSLGLADNTQGALVTQVAEGSAAARAGIAVSDVITSVRGQAIRTNAELRNAIGLLKVGDSVAIGLLREGRPMTLTAVLREPAQLADASAIHPALAGAELVEATEDAGGGVRVRTVQPGSPAAQVGLVPEDRIIAVNRARIASLLQLREAAKDQTSLLLQLRRGNQVLLLPLR